MVPLESDMRTATLIREIEKRMISIGKERDKLDAMIETMTALQESCDRAWESLQEARDALSEHA